MDHIQWASPIDKILIAWTRLAKLGITLIASGLLYLYPYSRKMVNISVCGRKRSHWNYICESGDSTFSSTIYYFPALWKKVRGLGGGMCLHKTSIKLLGVGTNFCGSFPWAESFQVCMSIGNFFFSSKQETKVNQLYSVRVKENTDFDQFSTDAWQVCWTVE